ncbi:MAG: hypothetical protein LBH00_03940 [Planctomycetaceae bacterium]|nr:hypothetical protein [Planctomycetaceae bacterium]
MQNIITEPYYSLCVILDKRILVNPQAAGLYRLFFFPASGTIVPVQVKAAAKTAAARLPNVNLCPLFPN